MPWVLEKKVTLPFWIPYSVPFSRSFCLLSGYPSSYHMGLICCIVPLCAQASPLLGLPVCSPDKVFSFSLLLSKTKETTFQTLKRTIWMRNKAFISGMSLGPTCLRYEEPETMEHLSHACANYSAKIWALPGQALSLALFHHTGDMVHQEDLAKWNMCITKLTSSFSCTLKTRIHKKW
jgi:hypothetical protein